MKKNRIAVLAVAAMMTAALMMTACGGSADTGNAGNTGSDTAPASNEQEAAEDVTDSGGESSLIGNPWQDNVSADDVYSLVNAYFIVPPAAANVTYRIMESEKLAEMDFELDGLKYTERMKPSDTFEDISGLYYEWDVDEEQDVAGSEGRARRAVTDEETVDSLLWLDKGMGMMFSLFTSDRDLDGFDIVAVAESMYQPETEEFMPGSFVEEAAGKGNFESFDELLSYLKKDNAYAYFELEGFDGKLLAVTESTYDDLDGHRAAIDATFYGEVNGNVRFVGNAFSDGTAYPLRCDGILVYDAGNHRYESEFMNPSGDALMIKDYISQDYDENGNVSYSGFMRESNSSADKDIPEDAVEAEKLFDSFFAELENKPVMDFTVVE